MMDFQVLPTQGTIGELTQAFLSLAKKHLTLPGFMKLPRASLNSLPIQTNPTVLAESIQQAFSILLEMHLVKETMMWEQWAQLFHRVLKMCTMAMEPDLHPGVRVLDAMSARGLPFRAVFLIGLNENVFPRYIREDAFLRDRSRRVLEETFGYKIDEKLGGYDEERLLFALMATAAQQRFYLVYQRANKEGRLLTASPFLTEYLSSDSVVHSSAEIIVPRRLSDRFTHPFFTQDSLTREEYGLQLIEQGYDPTSLLAKEGREPQLFQDGWITLKKTERHGRQLGAYDGLIRFADRYWQERVQKGMTPTSLEVYARCPFQFLPNEYFGSNR